MTIVVAGAIAYATSFGGVFLFDDVRHILQDEWVRQLQGLPGRRPLVKLSLALNFRIGHVEPFGYHLFNLSIHLLAGLALFGLIRRAAWLTPQRRVIGASASTIAGVVALLWTVHPLQTQAVTYVIQRAESMMALFYLLTLYCIVRAADSRSTLR